LPYTYQSGNSIKAATVADTANTEIGVVFKAERDHEIDAALIEIDPAKIQFVNNYLPQIGKPQKPRQLSNNDKNKTKAYMFGAKSGEKFGRTEGTVTSVYSDIKVTYNNDSEYTIINTVAISNNGKAISQSGDSGACVVDENYNVLGLVVAGSSEVTYILPVNTLLAKMKVQLV
jgi:hypothetical protein